MPVSKNIRYCRKKANMTQQDLADAIGTTKRTVISWELKRSAVPMPTAKRIADFFGVSFMEFCDLDLEDTDCDCDCLTHIVRMTTQDLKAYEMYKELPESLQSMVRQVIASAYNENSQE